MLCEICLDEMPNGDWADTFAVCESCSKEFNNI